jgi:hypothetical protein
VDSSYLISKVPFPRLVIPLAAAFGAAVDSAVTLVLLFALLVIYGIKPTPALLALPAFLLLALVAAVAAGVWLAALNVRYRDVRYTIPISRAVLVLCHADRLSDRPHHRAMAPCPGAQSADRDRGGMPVGAHRDRCP